MQTKFFGFMCTEAGPWQWRSFNHRSVYVHSYGCVKSGFQLSVESNSRLFCSGLNCFSATLSDWLVHVGNFVFNQAIRGQAKTTLDFFAPRFPALITGDKYLLRALIGSWRIEYFVIGQNGYFGFGFTIFTLKPLDYLNKCFGVVFWCSSGKKTAKFRNFASIAVLGDS